MAGLVIHQSNRIEKLAASLALQMASDRRDPLQPATIVVQSRGMERWLCLELTRHNGVVANIRFPFPNTILSEIFAAVLESAEQNDLFEVDPLTFRIMATLPDLIDDELFAPLHDYIGTSNDSLRQYQLCQKIAVSYDQLTTFRPELIHSWDQGQFDSWHGALWHHMLSEDERQQHRPELFQRFLERISRWQGDLPGIPDRLFIFGISTLPRLHLEALAAISRHINVEFFLLNPCQEYWHDVASDKVQVKLAQKRLLPQQDDEEQHFDRGHPLLSAQGTLVQEFLNLLTDFDPEYRELYQYPGNDTLLQSLQSQILELIDPGCQEKQTASAADDSIQIHSCHAPIREVEILKDVLLNCLSDDPALEPRDILVMAPDIEAYAPYISAVFEGEPQPQQKIPFSIADRSSQKESPLAEAFLQLLSLRGGRMTATQVLELLEEPTVRVRFDLDVHDLDLIRHWVRDTRICWGIDATFKANLKLPAQGNNTWRAGFDRMLLGFAMPTNEQQLFKEILPYDPIEGAAAATLGRFYSYCEDLFAVVAALEEQRTLAGWDNFLTKTAHDFFSCADENEQFKLLRQLNSLSATERASGYREKVPFEVIHSRLEKSLCQASSSGFLRGRVTFCSLLPMRSIPFKVVALLGMNDSAFPRKSSTVSFDLMTRQPRKGDPSRRKEDRYLFLEAILSARNKLIISYTGQSLKDNNEAPPSVVVAELLDVLEQGFAIDGKSSLREQIVTRHRLQGFNPVYFAKDSPLYSFSSDNFLGAVAQASGKQKPVPFLQQPLTAIDDDENSVSLAQLVSFLRNPAQYFLRNQLGIYLRDSAVTLDDQEPFCLDGLASYQVTNDLVETILNDETESGLYDLYAAKGVLPHGGLAAPTFEVCGNSAEKFCDKVQTFIAAQQPQIMAFDETFNGLRLTGQLSGLYPQGLIRYRCAKIKPKDRLAAWVYHLACCLIIPPEKSSSYQTRLLGVGSDDETYCYNSKSRAILAELLRIYREGLLRPLPFFPEAAFSYANALKKGASEQKSLLKARSSWQGNDYSAGEQQDVDFDFCFGRIDPLNEEFTTLAKAVVSPLLSGCKGGD